MNEAKICVGRFCREQFEITDKDRQFYQKMGVAEPKFCFDCRQQQKLAFRNERKLYHNVCKLCQKPFISIYSKDKPYPVFCALCWWGDGWNPLDYGRDFDFDRPFFEQFKELWDAVPKLGLLTLGDMVNSDYAHDAYRLANCYLVFDGEQGKDCYYGETFSNLEDCCDFLFIQRSRLCYECVNCNDCYNVNFSRYSYNCSDSSFLLNCRSCRNCFACVNLQQKEYHIFNKPYSPEEFKKIVASYNTGDYTALQKFKKETEEFYQKFPKKYLNGIMNENVTGDNLNGCKDTFDSYDCANLRDCRYCTNMLMGASDCYDVNMWGDNLSLAYNGVGIGAGGQNIVASYYAAFGVNNIHHSAFCFNDAKNMFGCVGIQHKNFCILNKQYTEAEYNQLKSKIIEHMRKTHLAGLEEAGEWAEFFPFSLSAFGYNETVAQEYYPLTKEQALARGFKWKDPDPKEYVKQTYHIPDHIKDVPDGIIKEILTCIDCGKNFKIVLQELKFYRRKNLPIPRKCSDCRHIDRLKLRNPRKLWSRECSKCGTKIGTTYAPNKKDLVYCESCYQEVVL